MKDHELAMFLGLPAFSVSKFPGRKVEILEAVNSSTDRRRFTLSSAYPDKGWIVDVDSNSEVVCLAGVIRIHFLMNSEIIELATGSRVGLFKGTACRFVPVNGEAVLLVYATPHWNEAQHQIVRQQ